MEVSERAGSFNIFLGGFREAFGNSGGNGWGEGWLHIFVFFGLMNSFNLEHEAINIYFAKIEQHRAVNMDQLHCFRITYIRSALRPAARNGVPQGSA
jgi:hypothetical protein